MHCTYVLHLGALLKSIVATILFSNHHHNHNVIHPTVSMITELLTHTNTQNDVHTWMQGSSSTQTHTHIHIYSYTVQFPFPQ